MEVILVDELSAQVLPGASFKLTENLFGNDGILDIGKISVLLENFHRTTGMANQPACQERYALMDGLELRDILKDEL